MLQLLPHSSLGIPLSPEDNLYRWTILSEAFLQDVAYVICTRLFAHIGKDLLGLALKEARSVRIAQLVHVFFRELWRGAARCGCQNHHGKHE
jgi:hypothetical protein